eukprot:389883-Rhodomonas_salina.1
MCYLRRVIHTFARQKYARPRRRPPAIQYIQGCRVPGSTSKGARVPGYDPGYHVHICNAMAQTRSQSRKRGDQSLY